MKTFYAIIVFLTLLLAGCTNRATKRDAWVWPAADTLSDSLVSGIERLHNFGAPRDSVMFLLDGLRRASERKGPAQRSVTARFLYMKGRQMWGDGDVAGARRALEKGKGMVDSAKNPYDFHRFSTLLNSFQTDDARASFLGLLDDLEFYRACGDKAMAATVSILMGHRLSGASASDKALRYYQIADSLYGVLGFGVMKKKNKINIANQLKLLGRHAETDSILKELRADGDIVRDPKAYRVVLRNSYLSTGDVSYLKKAYAMERDEPASASLRAVYELMLSEYYFEVKREFPDSAFYYSRKAVEKIGSVSNQNHRAAIWLAEAKRLSAEGKPDSAFIMQSRHIEAQKRHTAETKPLEVIGVQNVSELTRLEHEISRTNQLYEIRMLYLGLAVLIVLAMLAGTLFIRERRHKHALERHMNQKMEAERNMERARRQLMAVSLARQESEKTLDAVKDEVESLRKDGKVGLKEASVINQALLNHSVQKNDWNLIEEQFEKTEPDFMRRLRERAPGITENQLRLAVYIHIGMTNKQISSFMNIRPESIKQARWRLRSRLSLPAEVSLEEFLRYF